MKNIIFILLLFSPLIMFAQPFGNEWINYNQTYFKIPITKEGVYRISRQTLVNNSFPISAIDTRNLQMFYRGTEQPIYIYGDLNGTLTNNGYIEFYAKGNDGWLDSLLFEPITDITNPYYSMYSDTAYYYLTYNNLLSGNKRITFETDSDFANPSYLPVPYCLVTSIYQNPQYYYGADNGPRYLKGEGWFDSYFGLGQTITPQLATPGYVSGYLPTKINMSFATNSHYGHHLNATLGTNIIIDTVFWGMTSIKKTYYTFDNILTNTTFNISSVNDINAQTDNIEVAYITIQYCRNFDFSNLYKQHFLIENSTGAKTVLNISGLSNNGAVLYDLTNNRKLPVIFNNAVHKAVVPNANGIKECFIISNDSVKYIPKLEKINFIDYLPGGFNNTDYVIITNNILWQGATNYKNYRNSTGFSASCYNIEQLYDQFSFGIKKHPLAIKNFLRYLSTPSVANDSAIKYVFLIGKGIHSGSWLYSESFRKNSQNFENCLVPSFGNPSSDNMLTTKITTNNYTNDIPIGRLAATTNEEVNIYLSKITEHETNTQAEWMKRILHFGGGTTTAQQNTFAGYLNNFKAIIEDTLFGGNVQTFLKTTSLPIQITVADSVKNLINSGTSIITFFGHGYTDGFDQNIEEPTEYNNRYKYPLLIANSCLTGDIFLPLPKKISERWIFEQNKGALAFLATVDLGYDVYLNLYTNELYKQFSYKNYMKPVGSSIVAANKQLYNDFSSTILNTCLEFTLHGDPAFSLKCIDKPDLTISVNSISSVPKIVTDDIDSFYVKSVITNIGKAINDTFFIRINRTFPDGTTDIYYDVVNGCHFKDTIFTKVPVNFIKGTGLNQFCVTVDAYDSIPEANENNNVACTNITIRSNEITPIYPFEYAIFPNNTLKLKASTGFPFTPNQSYIFEIDTTDLFTNAVSGTVNQIGGVIEWQPPITLTDSTVYFWRVSPVPQGSQPYSWKESSFTYIDGKTGWSQGHFFQFKKDIFESINYNRNIRKLEFVNAPKQLHVHNIGSAYTNSQYNQISFFIDAITDHTSCGPSYSILVVIIDPYTLNPWYCNEHGDYGQINYPKCPSHSGYNKYFVFPADTPHLQHLENFIYSIPNNYFIVAYTFRCGNLHQWPETTYQAFESLSSNTLQLRSLPNNVPYVFFCQKGNLNSAIETFGATPNDTIDFYTQLPSNFTKGNVYSTLIGPATSWQTLHWKQSTSEQPSKDSTYLELKALKTSLDSVSAIPYLATNQNDIFDLYNYVNVNTYPLLKFRLFTNDDSLKTPSQLKLWQVTYDEAPETAINPIKGYLFFSDTISEGDNLKFSVATENISRYNMDSLLVKYWIQDKNNQIKNIVYRKLRPHPSGDVLRDTITINTLNLTGLNHIWYEVNPIDTNTGTYNQLEQYHFNNIAEKPFYVLQDKFNPLLDVTFDGIHIINGDIISAKPYILISLKDENKFIALNDTSLFGIYLKNLQTETEQRIYFNSSSNTLNFIPAQLPKNSCKIEYRPLLNDGKYELRIQAKDMSNNESGSNDYKIQFEVITKSTITNIYNYPNPFSTSTRFVFTLTGSQIPDDLRIQIFTITGKFIREIGLNEMGNVHVGNNITEFAWDGTDMYGDKLANGVYFYKVIARLNNSSIEHRDTPADNLFKNNIGKLYILR